MIRGRISKLLPLNGCGFITSAGLLAHTRFNSSAVEGMRFEELHEGQEVEFLFQRLDWARNPQAICVRPILSAERTREARPKRASHR